jgi:hypothetical protein
VAKLESFSLFDKMDESYKFPSDLMP